MTNLTTLPPEIRNIIYKLLLVRDHSIPITSPLEKRKLKKKQLRTYFGSILRVNKQLSSEAKTVFYGCNSFIVGNGMWASTCQANIHGLKAFIKRVPKGCISLIRSIELDVACAIFYLPDFYEVVDVRDLQIITRSLMKNFKGVEMISVGAIPVNWSPRTYEAVRYLPRGTNLLNDDLERESKAFQTLLSLPSLVEIYFHPGSTLDIAVWAHAVLERYPEANGKVQFERTS